jgi:hypothetical protein
VGEVRPGTPCRLPKAKEAFAEGKYAIFEVE